MALHLANAPGGMGDGQLDAFGKLARFPKLALVTGGDDNGVGVYYGPALMVEQGAMVDDTALPEDVAALYRRAFEEFGASALWSSKPVADPTAADALAITRSLRVEGDMRARRLAEEIELACRHAVS